MAIQRHQQPPTQNEFGGLQQVAHGFRHIMIARQTQGGTIKELRKDGSNTVVALLGGVVRHITGHQHRIGARFAHCLAQYRTQAVGRVYTQQGASRVRTQVQIRDLENPQAVQGCPPDLGEKRISHGHTVLETHGKKLTKKAIDLGLFVRLPAIFVGYVVNRAKMTVALVFHYFGAARVVI